MTMEDSTITQQITEPVYTRAVARWRQYARHLEPIMPQLDRFLDAFGYR